MVEVGFSRAAPAAAGEGYSRCYADAKDTSLFHAAPKVGPMGQLTGK
jgi:hypothetical protein